MNTTTCDRTNIGRTLTTVAALALTVAIAPAGSAAGTDGNPKQDVCRLAPQYLPRTPDAVEGWLRHCSR